MTEVISRKSAKAAGVLRYFTGKPCKRGHLAPRHVGKKDCVLCRPLDYKAWYDLDYAKNKKKYKSKNRRYYEENYDDVRAQLTKYRSENRAWMAAVTEEWRKANPERSLAYRRNYRARKRNAAGTHTAGDIIEIFRLQRGKCAYCKVGLGDGYCVDHIIALARGGSNDRRNLQLLCRPCNTEKHATDPLVFARRRGMLL